MVVYPRLMKIGLLSAFTITVVLLVKQASAQIFTPAEIVEWEQEVFAGPVEYTLATVDGQPAVQADCRPGGAVALYQPMTIDLAKTPILEWSWWIEHAHRGEHDETRRAGDDYAARIYAVRDGGLLAWRTRAVNYVWAANQSEGAIWPNAFAKQAQMLAIRSGNEAAGQWRTERRNLADDFAALHGQTPHEIDGIAIMTDCDNINQPIRAYYGAIKVISDE